MTKNEWIEKKLNYLNEQLADDIKQQSKGEWLPFGLPQKGDIKEFELVQCLEADRVQHPLDPVFLIKGDYYRCQSVIIPEIYESAFYEADESELEYKDYEVIGYRDAEINIELNEKIEYQMSVKRKRNMFGKIEIVQIVFNGEQWENGK